MNIKKGDNVIILAGNDKGKKAKVLKVLIGRGRVLIEGVSEVLRRRKPRKGGEKGQVITMSQPIDISNVALYCGSCDKAARIGVNMKGDKRERVCTRCKGSI
jgi:large subunit ribosomal protein L24